MPSKRRIGLTILREIEPSQNLELKNFNLWLLNSNQFSVKLVFKVLVTAAKFFIAFRISRVSARAGKVRSCSAYATHGGPSPRSLELC